MSAAGPAPRDLRGLEGIDRMLSREPFGTVDPSAAPTILEDVLGVPALPAATPSPVEIDGWSRDGVETVALEWDAGFGAPAAGWLLRPAGETGSLPGVNLLHCHGGMKHFGKEKVADGPGDLDPQIAAFRAECYAGRAVANDIARAGHAVLVPDAFGWGGRRIPMADFPSKVRRHARLVLAERGDAREPDVYDIHAAAHEDVLAKTLGVLGTSWGGVIAHGDLLAGRLLAERADVAPGGVVMAGFSGGGARAVIASVLSDDVRATAAIAMMSTFRPLVDGLMHAHSWTLMNPGIGRVGDWPDIAAARAPRPLFVGYAERDALFPREGMRKAHALIRGRYATAPDAYQSVWEDVPHAFGTATQRALLDWLISRAPADGAA